MRIVGLEKNSLVDYLEKIAAVVFTPGCNLDCYYCHNRAIIAGQETPTLLPEADVLSFLKKRKDLLDGVVISGGEPTLQKDLPTFCGMLKNLGYRVKLDTNGSNPELVRDLIAKHLVDYVAMDLKAPFAKHEQICGKAVGFAKNEDFLERIKQSIQLLLSAKVPYEFRTTFVPELTGEDIREIATTIRGAKLYVLQQYRVPILPADQKMAARLLRAPHPASYLRDTAQSIAGLVEQCQTRGI